MDYKPVVYGIINKCKKEPNIDVLREFNECKKEIMYNIENEERNLLKEITNKNYKEMVIADFENLKLIIELMHPQYLLRASLERLKFLHYIEDESFPLTVKECEERFNKTKQNVKDIKSRIEKAIQKKCFNKLLLKKLEEENNEYDKVIKKLRENLNEFIEKIKTFSKVVELSDAEFIENNKNILIDLLNCCDKEIVPDLTRKLISLENAISEDIIKRKLRREKKLNNNMPLEKQNDQLMNNFKLLFKNFRLLKEIQISLQKKLKNLVLQSEILHEKLKNDNTKNNKIINDPKITENNNQLAKFVENEIFQAAILLLGKKNEFKETKQMYEKNEKNYKKLFNEKEYMKLYNIYSTTNKKIDELLKKIPEITDDLNKYLEILKKKLNEQNNNCIQNNNDNKNKIENNIQSNDVLTTKLNNFVKTINEIQKLIITTIDGDEYKKTTNEIRKKKVDKLKEYISNKTTELTLNIMQLCEKNKNINEKTNISDFFNLKFYYLEDFLNNKTQNFDISIYIDKMENLIKKYNEKKVSFTIEIKNIITETEQLINKIDENIIKFTANEPYYKFTKDDILNSLDENINNQIFDKEREKLKQNYEICIKLKNKLKDILVMITNQTNEKKLSEISKIKDNNPPINEVLNKFYSMLKDFTTQINTLQNEISKNTYEYHKTKGENLQQTFERTKNEIEKQTENKQNEILNTIQKVQNNITAKINKCFENIEMPKIAKDTIEFIKKINSDLIIFSATKITNDYLQIQITMMNDLIKNQGNVQNMELIKSANFLIEYVKDFIKQVKNTALIEQYKKYQIEIENNLKNNNDLKNLIYEKINNKIHYTENQKLQDNLKICEKLMKNLEDIIKNINNNIEKQNIKQNKITDKSKIITKNNNNKSDIIKKQETKGSNKKLTNNNNYNNIQISENELICNNIINEIKELPKLNINELPKQIGEITDKVDIRCKEKLKEIEKEIEKIKPSKNKFLSLQDYINVQNSLDISEIFQWPQYVTCIEGLLLIKIGEIEEQDNNKNNITIKLLKNYCNDSFYVMYNELFFSLQYLKARNDENLIRMLIDQIKNKKQNSDAEKIYKILDENIKKYNNYISHKEEICSNRHIKEHMSTYQHSSKKYEELYVRFKNIEEITNSLDSTVNNNVLSLINYAKSGA